LKAVTVEDNYPYNFKKDGELQGLGFDVINTLAQRAGFKLSIEILPWTRALKTAATEPSVLIFSLARMPDRENLYYWFGPMVVREIWLYKLSSRTDITISSLEDIKRYQVGDTASNATLLVMKNLGIKADTAPSDLSSCRKFKIGRVDLVPIDPMGISAFMTGCGLAPEQAEKVILLARNMGLYIGIGKNTPPEIVNRLNVEFEAMRKDQTLQKINDKWKFSPD